MSTDGPRLIIPGELASQGRGDRFRQFAHAKSCGAGSPRAFAAGVLAVVLWALSGPLFGFSETWQLVVNTGTTIITFLMVFVIQNTQARDSKEMHLKLDELLRAVETARATVINCADLSDEELQEIDSELHTMVAQNEWRSTASAQAPGAQR